MGCGAPRRPGRKAFSEAAIERLNASGRKGLGAILQKLIERLRGAFMVGLGRGPHRKRCAMRRGGLAHETGFTAAFRPKSRVY